MDQSKKENKWEKKCYFFITKLIKINEHIKELVNPLQIERSCVIHDRTLWCMNWSNPTLDRVDTIWHNIIFLGQFEVFNYIVQNNKIIK